MLACFYLIISIVLIIYSSELIVNETKVITQNLKISEKRITMFIIVVGTSLPKIIMTIAGAKK